MTKQLAIRLEKLERVLISTSQCRMERLVATVSAALSAREHDLISQAELGCQISAAHRAALDRQQQLLDDHFERLLEEDNPTTEELEAFISRVERETGRPIRTDRGIH